MGASLYATTWHSNLKLSTNYYKITTMGVCQGAITWYSNLKLPINITKHPYSALPEWSPLSRLLSRSSGKWLIASSVSSKFRNQSLYIASCAGEVALFIICINPYLISTFNQLFKFRIEVRCCFVNGYLIRILRCTFV